MENEIRTHTHTHCCPDFIICAISDESAACVPHQCCHAILPRRDCIEERKDVRVPCASFHVLRFSHQTYEPSMQLKIIPLTRLTSSIEQCSPKTRSPHISLPILSGQIQAASPWPAFHKKADKHCTLSGMGKNVMLDRLSLKLIRRPVDAQSMNGLDKLGRYRMHVHLSKLAHGICTSATS